MTALNELAQRHGLEPYDFTATVQTTTSMPGPGVADIVLRFETPPPEVKAKAYWQMMSNLGIPNPNGPELAGTEESVWKTLQTALKRAPTPRGRT